MPHDGYFLRTGGSARRRIIKPSTKQALTNRFPIPTVNYKVSGVPGHTHNSSAVLSVLCDLQKTRGRNITMEARVWCEEKTQMEEKDPGDSDVVDNEDARFERALERGIGEICMRPENCHEEIREPVRSISEIRTLVAPNDRLQTLTYVEELGGFVNQDGTPFLSDYNDVFVNILGDTDPIRTEAVVADLANLTRISLHNRDVHCSDTTSTTPQSWWCSSAAKQAQMSAHSRTGPHGMVLCDSGGTLTRLSTGQTPLSSLSTVATRSHRTQPQDRQ